MSAASDEGADTGGGGSGGGGPSKAENSKGKSAKGSRGAKGKDSPLLLCGWCEKPGAKRRCTQCKSEVYCNQECQRVSKGGGGGGRREDTSPLLSLPPEPLDPWAQELLPGRRPLEYSSGATSS